MIDVERKESLKSYKISLYGLKNKIAPTPGSGSGSNPFI